MTAKVPDVAVEMVKLPLVLVMAEVPPPLTVNAPVELPSDSVFPAPVAREELPVTERPPVPWSDPDPAFTPTKMAAPAPLTLH